MNTRRSSNPAICLVPIALGAAFFSGMVLLGFFLTDNIVKNARAETSLEGFSNVGEISSIDRQIEFKDFDIKLAESMPDSEKALRDALKKLDALSNKKTTTAETPSGFEADKAAKIQKLKDEKTQLIAKKNELIGKRQAEKMRPRSWEEWLEDYNIELLMVTIPLVALACWLVPMTFWWKLPANNPFSLTDFERRCVLFLPVAIVMSTLGFLLYVWFLTVYS